MTTSSDGHLKTPGDDIARPFYTRPGTHPGPGRCRGAPGTDRIRRHHAPAATARSRVLTSPAERHHAFLVGLNFAAVYVLWGSTYMAIRAGVRDLPPALMAGSRFLTAGAILLVFLLVRRVPLPPRAMLGPVALTGLLLLFGGNLLVTMAEITVPSGMAAVIVANLPFFMVVFEALRRGGERINALGLLGIVVGFAGMLILTWPKIRFLPARGLGGMKGEAMLLGANLCWTVGSIYSKHRVRDV